MGGRTCGCTGSPTAVAVAFDTRCMTSCCVGLQGAWCEEDHQPAATRGPPRSPRRCCRAQSTTLTAPAERHTRDGLATDAHPGIVFKSGPPGRRAALAGGPASRCSSPVAVRDRSRRVTRQHGAAVAGGLVAWFVAGRRFYEDVAPNGPPPPPATMEPKPPRASRWTRRRCAHWCRSRCSFAGDRRLRRCGRSLGASERQGGQPLDTSPSVRPRRGGPLPFVSQWGRVGGRSTCSKDTTSDRFP